MKLKDNTELTEIFDALNISKSMEVFGGPVVQNHYVESNTFIPNRFLTPLVINPIVYVKDNHNIIPEGDKHWDLEDLVWYENGIPINFREDDGYRENQDNSIIVLKNSEVDINLSYTAKFFDIRKKQYIGIEDQILLITMPLSEGDSEPKMVINRPVNYIVNPLKSPKEIIFEAEFFSGSSIIDIPIYWFIKYPNGTIKIIEENELIYKEGQGTNRLVLNADFLDDCTIFAYNTQHIMEEGAFSDEVKYYRKFPSSLFVEILSTQVIKENNTRVKAQVVVGYKEGIIENPGKFFKITWYKYSPDGVENIGEGEYIYLNVFNNDSISVEIEDLGIYKV